MTELEQIRESFHRTGGHLFPSQIRKLLEALDAETKRADEAEAQRDKLKACVESSAEHCENCIEDAQQCLADLEADDETT